MMKRAIFPTEAAAKAYRARVNKAMGYPLRDVVRIGGGRHTQVHPTTPGPGWTIHHSELRKHPTKDEWAHLAIDPVTVVHPEALDAADSAALDAAWASATDLDASWDETK